MKTAVVYFSSTGNTEDMANAVLEGMKDKGAEAELITSAEFSADRIGEFDAIAFGCPAMGDEVLEEDEFQPLWDSCKDSLSGKKIALFGSYGWGDCEWMRNWEEDAKSAGAELACESVTCMDAPDDDGVAACKALGAALC